MWTEIVKQVAIHAALAFIKPRLKVRRKVHPLWYNIALRERGVIEIPGPRHNPRILEYHQASNGDFDSDEIPWCASFVNWCLSKAGYFNLHSASARSYLKWGQSCEPYEGCIVVLKRGNQGWQGHVGFYVKHDKHYVWVLGGNQDNKVCIKPYPMADVLDFRAPNQENRVIDPREEIKRIE